VSLRRRGPAASWPAKAAKAFRPGLPAATSRPLLVLRLPRLHREEAAEVGRRRAGLEAVARGLAAATPAPLQQQQHEEHVPPPLRQEEWEQALATKARPWQGA